MTIETVEQPTESESAIEDRVANALFGSDEAEQVEEENEAGIEASEQAEDPPEVSAEPELEDVEFSGKVYKLPPELKSALMQQSDYTRKTQEVADQRRMLDTQIMMVQQEQQFSQSVNPELQQLQILNSQLAQYRQLDWTQLDTDTATRARIALDQLKDAKAEVEAQIGNKRGQFEQQMQGLMQQAREKGTEYLKRAIPNWGPDVGKELEAYGIQEGYSDVEIRSLTDARMFKTLWKAQQWDKLQSQKATSKPRVPNAPPLQKPGATPQSARASNDQYRANLAKAKSPGQREAIIANKVAQKFGL